MPVSRSAVSPSVIGGVLLALASACSSGSDESAGDARTSAVATGPVGKIEISDPDPRIEDLEAVESDTEEVADRLLDLGLELRARNFGKVGEWFADDFEGDRLTGLKVAQTDGLHLDAKRTEYTCAGVAGRRAEFVADLESLLGNWQRCELALWKTKGAEFQRGGRLRWGKVHVKLHFIGDTQAGGREEINAWAWIRVERRAGLWSVTQFQLESLERLEIVGRPFRDVSIAAGVAHRGIRYGKKGNTEDAWNGAACGDVDGDGLWDIFVPSYPDNFLYLNRGDGTFIEQAEARGVQGPSAGTGALFLDLDNDGDQDLFVAHRAWQDEKQGWHGKTLQAYLNDGQGNFSNATTQLGLDVHRYGFSATALDYDGDGWVDLFVAGYGRVSTEHNDDWLESRNGRPNSLFRNLNGQGFKDVAPELGLDGERWTYAAAAADYDGDGDTDLYAANDFGSNQLWENQGDGTFRDVAAELGVTDQGNGMGCAWGDLDGDGRLDLYVSNMSSTAGNRILARLWESLPEGDRGSLKKAAAGNSVFFAGEDGFERVPASAGGIGANWAWSTALTDLDNDGCLDVFCVNGFATGDLPHDT